MSITTGGHYQGNPSDLKSELEKVVFEYIIKENKFIPFFNGPEYPFIKKLDNSISGCDHELIVYKKVAFEKPFLSDEADVEHNIKTLNEALIAEIRKGKKIQI